MKIVNIMASSLDGFIAIKTREDDHERMTAGLSSPEDQEFLRQELSQSDAVIIGANSIRSNGGCAVLSPGEGANPHWFILTSQGLEARLPFWQQHTVPRTLVARDKVSVYASDVNLLTYGVHDHVTFLVKTLEMRGFKRVLLFGGGDINADYYNQKQVHELKLTLSPVLVGSKNAPHLLVPKLTVPIQLSLMASHVKGNFVFLHYTVG